jgi:hypothetical protein
LAILTTTAAAVVPAAAWVSAAQWRMRWHQQPATDIPGRRASSGRGCPLPTKPAPEAFAEGAREERSGALLVLGLERVTSELPDSGREHGGDGGGLP